MTKDPYRSYKNIDQEPEDPDTSIRGNANGVKVADYMDAMLILRKAVKLIDKFPVELPE